jgi:hypothetical protein
VNTKNNPTPINSVSDQLGHSASSTKQLNLPSLSSWEMKPECEEFLTKSQQAALSLLIERAEAFFSPGFDELKIKPRLSSLLVGPTGVGKTTLARKLAEHMGAGLFVVSAGEWNIRASRHQPATLAVLLDQLKEHKRLIFLLDEIDKFTAINDQEWTRAVSAEIWATLDRRLPIEDFYKKPDEIQTIHRRCQEGLYFIGAGTFQDVFSLAQKPACGFMGNNGNCSDTDLLGLIKKNHRISPELVSRFSPRPIVLRYPDLVETADLLRRTGLTRVAGWTDMTLDPRNVDWQGAGMRALEQLAADVVIAARRELNMVGDPEEIPF